MNPIVFKEAQIVLTLILIFLIQIQAKGKGLASGIGSSFSFYGSKRGVEKFVFIATIISTILLIANSLLLVIKG